MKKPSLEDYRLYLVTDPVLNRGYSVLEQVELALKGGVKIVQIREKGLNTRDFIALARKALEITRPEGAYLLINDRIDVALAADADGVHLGQEDIPLVDARRLLGPNSVIGVSTRTPAEAAEAERDGADYLAANGVFLTDTKRELEVELGLEGVSELRKATKLPLIAIGGIKIDNCESVIRAGANGVAVVTGITMAEDIPKACSGFFKAIKNGLI
jgi:thiamine-phosphate pyrophosphorylase